MVISPLFPWFDRPACRRRSGACHSESFGYPRVVRELNGWIVTVVEVRFMPELEAPSEKPYPFLYAIAIRNESDETVTLRGRKWVVREDNGDTVVVEGEGVIGEMPVFEKGPRSHFIICSPHRGVGVNSKA